MIDVIDLTAEMEAIASTPSAAAVARERLQVAIVELAIARHDLFAVDPHAAVDLDVMLVRILFGHGGRA